MRKSERKMTLNKYYKYLQENDTIISKAMGTIKEGKQGKYKRVLTEEFIEHCHTLDLHNRDIARLLGCAVGTAATYVAEYNFMKRDELSYEEIDYTEYVKDFREENKLKTLTEEDNIFLIISDIQAGAMVTSTGLDLDPLGTVDKYFVLIKEEFKRVIFNRKIVIKNLNLVFLGDLVEGWGIFANQLALPVKAQKDCLAKNILNLVSWLSTVINPEQTNIYSVYGNHGRVSRHHELGDNWDVDLMSRVDENLGHLQEYNVNFKNIVSHISDQRIQKHDIGNFTYLMTHGDQLGSASSSAIEAKVGKWTRSKGWFDAVLLGHWHQFKWYSLDNIQIVMGGCTYESPFVQDQIGGKEDIVQVVFASSATKAVAWVELLDVKLD